MTTLVIQTLTYMSIICISVHGQTDDPSITTASPLAGITDEPVCQLSSGPNAELNLLTQLRTTFSGDFTRPLDIIYLIDRSQSIGPGDFNATKELIKELTVYLAQRRHIRVHKSYTRTAVVSFGIQATPEFDGIQGSEIPIDACIFTDRIDQLTLANRDTNGSNIAYGLNRVQQLFKIGKQQTNRNESKQVVFIFFDGAEGIPISYGGRTALEISADMQFESIRVFTVGVGAWLKAGIERERRVSELAISLDYHACVDTWLNALRTATKSDLREQDDDPLFNEISPEYKSIKCGVCIAGAQCACNVVSREYMCTNDELLSINAVGAPSRGKNDSDWLMPVAIAAGVVIFILLIVMVIVIPILAIRKKREREEERKFFEEQPIYEGPPLPPPVAPRRGNKYIAPSKDNVYGNYIEIHGPYSNDRGTNTSRTPSFSSDTSSLPSGDIGGIALYQTVEYPMDYENVEDPLHNEMESWPEFLYNIKTEKGLLHICIWSIPTKRWAITPRFEVIEKEVRDIEKIMRLFGTDPSKCPNKFKIATKEFIVDPGELSQIHMHATRTNRRHVKETVWVSKVFDYVIVGIANETEDETCCVAVYDIHRHMHDTITSSGQIQGQVVDDTYFVPELPRRITTGI